MTPWPYTSRRQPPRAVLPLAEGVDLRTRRMVGADGVRHDVCYIGTLARLLGRSTATVRRWERLGILPATPFEEPVNGGPARRLYPVQWIVGVLRIAEAEGLAARRPACIAATNFTARTQQLHRELFG
ncbi:MAG: hypothetical protein JWL79_153 [Frankiales bacterium]|nr:hypothetical protein [Frankiales bacterium]